MMGGVSIGVVTGSKRAVNRAKATAKHRTSMLEQGFVQCNVWVPSGAVSDLKLLGEALRADFLSRDGELGVSVGPLRLLSTGRLCSAANVIRWAEEGGDD